MKLSLFQFQMFLYSTASLTQGRSNPSENIIDYFRCCSVAVPFLDVEVEQSFTSMFFRRAVEILEMVGKIKSKIIVNFTLKATQLASQLAIICPHSAVVSHAET
jgi:hypothetical protein